MITLADSRLSRRTAKQVMWDHYHRDLADGLPPPTGAELDAIAQTNNYGRAVLRKWHPAATAELARRRCRWFAECTTGNTRTLCWRHDQPLTPALRSVEQRKPSHSRRCRAS